MRVRIHSILLLSAACAMSAQAAPDRVQAQSFLRDFEAAVSQGQLNIETMPKRREQQARVDDLERRAQRLFAKDTTFAPCVDAANLLASTWTTQMSIAGGDPRPHMVAWLAHDSVMAGQHGEACRAAIEHLDAKQQAPTKR